MALRLRDKVAIVSGAGCIGPGWGNGRATTVRFVEEGANVFAVDRDAESMRETVDKAPGIATHVCDVTDSRAVAQMVRACLDRYGRIDVLVSNVGGAAAGGPVGRSEDGRDAQAARSVHGVCRAYVRARP